ncbi:cold shock domain-containing protein [Tsukamurella sp. 8F]|uniref:cold-shock protein n=1 Tax=unclassified Tsukamurella TaxID=2633480 RepID=UPI0023B8A5F3|nr:MULTISPECIES: cold shock domain-containing protein [unclassified Tsukamurella]MDF0529995.1 cold shock domain-containing protein [Tsukamurella sp. 8J]MDF0587233.1 cold shock domain-containing protein [Tsukamurella sp. 8F]
MVNGKVVYFDSQRGFGFLSPEAGGDDVFLHVNDIDFDEALLRPDVAVTFDVIDAEKGKKAVNVAVEGAPAGGAPKRERHDRGGRDHGDRGGRDHGRREHRPRGGEGAMDMQAFLDEITELLLDSSDDLTAGQIIAVRQRFTDFAYGRGWVTE